MKQIETITDLTPDKRNANRGTDRGQKQVGDSLRTYGAGRSILADKNGRIIAGNKTFEQAADMKLPVQVVKTSGDKLVVVQREDLDLESEDGKARMLAYADNRASEVGLEWDVELLAQDVAADVDLSTLWTDDELEALLADVGEPAPPVEFPAVDETIETEHECPKCGYKWSGGQ